MTQDELDEKALEEAVRRHENGICSECGGQVRDNYRVTDEVWIAAGMVDSDDLDLPDGCLYEGFLHFCCLEKRIGRKLLPEDLRPVGLGGVVRTVLTETASLRARVEELEREPEMPEGWALTKPSRIMFSDASGDTSVIDVTLYHALFMYGVQEKLIEKMRAENKKLKDLLHNCCYMLEKGSADNGLPKDVCAYIVEWIANTQIAGTTAESGEEI